MLGLELGQPGAHALDHLLRIGAAQAEHQTLHGLAFAVLRVTAP
jgi:hypothetical protein